MPAMLKTDQGKPATDKEIRSALRKWAFNTKNREDRPEKAAQIFDWLSRNTKPVTALADPKVTRAVLDLAATLLDGKPAAASTVQRNRAILHHACEYAVETGLLTKNPIKAIKWKAPKTSAEVDRRSVVNHTQARRLLDAVRQQEPSGPRLVAFFATIYYAGLRPEEAANLRRENVILPPLVWNEETQTSEEPADDWGELRFSTAAPEVGRRMDRRRQQTRTSPTQRQSRRGVAARPHPPPLTKLVRQHLTQYGTDSEGRIFTRVRSGELATVTYRRVWDRAREAALTPAEYASPLAKRVYDLRHACVSTWLNGGVEPSKVAELAGHSVAVLFRVYAKCIHGQDETAKRRIEAALRG